MHLVEPKPYTYHPMPGFKSLTLVHKRYHYTVTVKNPIGIYFTQSGSETIKALDPLHTLRNAENYRLAMGVTNGGEIVYPLI